MYLSFSQVARIGILDICGFENLSPNGLEQMLINIMNEQLQNFMNRHIIEEELRLFQEEGVEVGEIHTEHVNNDLILSLFMVSVMIVMVV